MLGFSIIALCFIASSCLSVQSANLPSRINVASCRKNDCLRALRRCNENKCDGIYPCKKCIKDFYPYCLDCIQEILDYDKHETINGMSGFACDPTDPIQESSCTMYCQSASMVCTCNKICEFPATTVKPPFPEGLVNTLVGHTDYITSVVVLENGKIASGSYDKTIKIWDQTTGLKGTLAAEDNIVLALAALHNGFLASGSRDNTIRIWDPTSFKFQYKLDGHTGRVCALAVLNNGYLASGSWDKTIKIWDPVSRTLIHTIGGPTGHTGNVCSLTVLDNGYLVSGSNDMSIKVWDPARSYSLVQTRYHEGVVWGLASIGRNLLASISNDKTMKVWKTNENFAGLKTHKFPEQLLTSVSISKKGNMVVGDADGNLLFWNPSDEVLNNSTRAHEYAIYSMALLPNGLLVTASGDHKLKLWNTKY